MTSSFPFFNIARNSGVPYREVMQLLEQIRSSEFSLGFEAERGSTLNSAIALAELAERKRRAEIQSLCDRVE